LSCPRISIIFPQNHMSPSDKTSLVFTLQGPFLRVRLRYCFPSLVQLGVAGLGRGSERRLLARDVFLEAPKSRLLKLSSSFLLDSSRTSGQVCGVFSCFIGSLMNSFFPDEARPSRGCSLSPSCGPYGLSQCLTERSPRSFWGAGRFTVVRSPVAVPLRGVHLV